MPALATRPTTCKPSRWPARWVQWPDHPTCFKGKTVMARMVQWMKLTREAEGLAYPPYPAHLGVRIWQSISKEARPADHTSELKSLMRISYAVFCFQQTKPP